MARSSCVLLVEGKADEAFYNKVCDVLKISASIKVAPPRSLGGNANNKEGVFQLLPSLLQQLGDGSLGRLALVVDADFEAEHGLGFKRTFDRVRDIVAEFGFKPVRHNGISGLFFSSSEGLHDIGLWVMPNNRDDGMLEDWVKSAIISDDIGLLQKAVDATGVLEVPKFKPIHKVKADVATWLSWQAAPGRGMEYAVQEKLIDHDGAKFNELAGWLRHIFS